MTRVAVLRLAVVARLSADIDMESRPMVFAKKDKQQNDNVPSSREIWSNFGVVVVQLLWLGG